MTKYKIYRVLENNDSTSVTKDENGNVIESITNTVYSSSILASLPVKIGTYYICLDTLNLYFDSNIGRKPIEYSFINTELDRVNMRLISSGYYYVGETNVLWVYNKGWKKQAYNENKNYPGYNMKDNGFNTYADSFKLLVDNKNNSIGTLIINPDISVTVEGDEISLVHEEKYLDENGFTKVRKNNYTSKEISHVFKSKDFGKMIYYGDYYIVDSFSGKVRKATDDGFVTDLNVGDKGESPEDGGDNV